MFTGITELKNRIWSWILRHWPGVCYYIGGAQVLPPPLEREEEREVFARLAEGDESASLIFFSGQKVLTALISPMVPMEMRSSIPMPVVSNFRAM